VQPNVRLRLHPHAIQCIRERGTSPAEVRDTVESGDRFIAKRGRTGFRRRFDVDAPTLGGGFDCKQVEVYAVWEDGAWLVITAIVKYFRTAEQDR
jgi:hypothetical protein